LGTAQRVAPRRHARRDVSASGPIVAVDPHTGTSTLPYVHADNFAGAITATEYLIGLGHRRIGFLAGRPDLESAQLRERGFREALATAGIGLDPELIRVGGFTPEASTEPARRLLTLPDRPTAIFAANDQSAIQTMIVARSLGLAVPEDLSVIGFDNVPESALADIPLTTIDQSIQTMGEEAVHLLVDLLDGVTDRPQQITLPTKLVVRQSVIPFPGHGGRG
jgi:LacI family transcriptional regulator